MRFAFELDVEFFQDVAERGRIHEFGEDFQSALVEFQEPQLDELRANPPSGWDDATAEASLDNFLSSTDRWLQIVEELGYGDAPDTWGEDVEAGAGDDLDLTPWVDRVCEEIMLPQRPS